MAETLSHKLGRLTSAHPKLVVCMAVALVALLAGGNYLQEYLEKQRVIKASAEQRARVAQVAAKLEEAQRARQAELAAMTPARRAEVAKKETAELATKKQKEETERLAQLAVKEAKNKEERDFQRVLFIGRAIKRNMKNPDSFKLEYAALMNDGTACYEYRGTNSFNAIVPEKKAFGADLQPRVWSRYCGGKSGIDMTHIKVVLNNYLS